MGNEPILVDIEGIGTMEFPSGTKDEVINKAVQREVKISKLKVKREKVQKREQTFSGKVSRKLDKITGGLIGQPSQIPVVDREIERVKRDASMAEGFKEEATDMFKQGLRTFGSGLQALPTASIPKTIALVGGGEIFKQLSGGKSLKEAAQEGVFTGALAGAIESKINQFTAGTGKPIVEFTAPYVEAGLKTVARKVPGVSKLEGYVQAVGDKARKAIVGFKAPYVKAGLKTVARKVPGVSKLEGYVQAVGDKARKAEEATKELADVQKRRLEYQRRNQGEQSKMTIWEAEESGIRNIQTRKFSAQEKKLQAKKENIRQTYEGQVNQAQANLDLAKKKSEAAKLGRTQEIIDAENNLRRLKEKFEQANLEQVKTTIGKEETLTSEREAYNKSIADQKAHDQAVAQRLRSKQQIKAQDLNDALEAQAQRTSEELNNTLGTLGRTLSDQYKKTYSVVGAQTVPGVKDQLVDAFETILPNANTPDAVVRGLGNLLDPGIIAGKTEGISSGYADIIEDVLGPIGSDLNFRQVAELDKLLLRAEKKFPIGSDQAYRINSLRDSIKVGLDNTITKFGGADANMSYSDLTSRYAKYDALDDSIRQWSGNKNADWSKSRYDVKQGPKQAETLKKTAIEEYLSKKQVDRATKDEDIQALTAYFTNRSLPHKNVTQLLGQMKTLNPETADALEKSYDKLFESAQAAEDFKRVMDRPFVFREKPEKPESLKQAIIDLKNLRAAKRTQTTPDEIKAQEAKLIELRNRNRVTKDIPEVSAAKEELDFINSLNPYGEIDAEIKAVKEAMADARNRWQADTDMRKWIATKDAKRNKDVLVSFDEEIESLYKELGPEKGAVKYMMDTAQAISNGIPSFQLRWTIRSAVALASSIKLLKQIPKKVGVSAVAENPKVVSSAIKGVDALSSIVSKMRDSADARVVLAYLSYLRKEMEEQ